MDLFKEYIYQFIDQSEHDTVIANDKEFIEFRTKIKHIKDQIKKCLVNFEQKETVISLIDDMSDMYLDMSAYFRYLDFKTAFLAGIVTGLKTAESDNKEISENIQKILEEISNERNRKHS